MNNQVSIIMPAFNAGKYIDQAIMSVLNQSWQQWELLVVDNGSSDDTWEKINRFDDPRIVKLQESMRGVSNARNCALQHMKGDYFTFLDADDRLPVNSISLRLSLFMQNPELEFADGRVEYWSKDFSRKIDEASPTFRGNPFRELIALSSSCICSYSWMIKRMPGKNYSFQPGWTHGEDVAFFISISKTGLYDFVSETTLEIRRGHVSAMSNLEALERGYDRLLEYIGTHEGVDFGHMQLLRKKVRRIMFRSYVKKLKLSSGILAWIKFSGSN